MGWPELILPMNLQTQVNILVEFCPLLKWNVGDGKTLLF